MIGLLEREPTYAPLHRSSDDRRGRRTPASIDRIVGVVVALIGTFVVGAGVNRYPALFGDEGIYMMQADSVLHGQLTPYTYTYDHPFFGWLQLAPLIWLVHLVTGGHALTVVVGRVVMTGFAFATLLLTYVIARRLDIRRGLAAAGVALLGLSPLFVTESRQVLLDNIALPWVLAAFALALSPRRRQWAYASAGICFAVAVLSKETLALLLPALVYTIWTRSYRPIRAMSLASFATLSGCVVAIYPLFAVLRGELLAGPGHVSLWSDGIAYQLASRKGSGAIWQAGSSRRGVLDTWLVYDHGLLLGGLAAAVVCLFIRRLRVVGIVAVLWAVPVLKPGGYLPQMYVIAVIPFCLLAVIGLLDAVGRLAARVAGRTIADRATVVVAGALASFALVAYVPMDRWITTSPYNDRVAVAAAAEHYVEARVTPSDNVLLDPAYWNDMIDAGLGHPWHGAIDYYQFDLDPQSSARYLPDGWKDIDYVVETREMRDNVQYLGLVNLASVLAHSRVIATFGTGDNVVRVRLVAKTEFNHGAQS